MSETNMPAAEAAELQSYELAFHVLPTVAEGEVSSVFDGIKSLITTNGGEIFDEETPERFDLAYEIVKHIEGKNRKFQSAYFGWVRFKLSADAVSAITEELEADMNILRHLLIKLTKVEEENPFHIHQALAAEKTVRTVDEAEPTAAAKPEVEAAESETTESSEVSEATESTEVTTETEAPTVAAEEEKPDEETEKKEA